MASEDITQMETSGLASFPKPESEKFFAKNYHNQFTSSLVTLCKNERLTDVTLKCKDVKLSCHKVVLAAASSYFNAMFCNAGFEESEREVVELKSFNPNILSTLVDFIYTAKVTLSTDNVQNICSACDELELVELKEGCDTFMSQRVGPANCFGLHIFAKHYNLKLTLEKCKDCMMTELGDILRLALNQELKTLTEDELIKYISNDDLEVEDEAMVFKLVEKWVMVDAGSRMRSVERLMEHVRLAYCSPSKLRSEIRQSPIMQSMKCANLLLDAFSYQAATEDKHLMAGSVNKPRRFGQQQLLLLDGGNNPQGKCWYFDTRKAQWSEFTTLPTTNLCHFEACVSGGEIVLTGGCISAYINAAWAFSLQTKQWRALPDMIHPRAHHAVVSIDDEVYVMGGHNANGRIDKVEKLDGKRQRWSQLASMKAALFYHMAVEIDKRIYVTGGCDQKNRATTMTQMYDVTTGQWENKASLPQACTHGSAVLLNKRIYVVGDGSQCCFSYDPQQDTWTTHNKPLQARSDPAAAVWKGKIVLCGGSSRNDVEEYDVEKDQWTKWPVTLPVGMMYHTMLTANASFN